MVPPWLQTLQVTNNLEIKSEPVVENSNKILMHNFQSTVSSHNISGGKGHVSRLIRTYQWRHKHTQCENGGGCEMSHPLLKLNHLLRTNVTPLSLSPSEAGAPHLLVTVCGF